MLGGINGFDFDSVVCVTGHKGAGKDEFCRRMTTRGYQSVRFSDPIRKEATRRFGKAYTVAQLVEIGDEGRRKNGVGYWADRLLDLALKKGWQKLVINGARNPGEIDAVSNRVAPWFTLVGITAPSMTRFERISKRGQVEDRPEIAKFLGMDDIDRGLGQPADGQQVDRCMAMVDRDRIYNNAGTLAEFYTWIDGVHEAIETYRRNAVH